MDIDFEQLFIYVAIGALFIVGGAVLLLAVTGEENQNATIVNESLNNTSNNSSEEFNLTPEVVVVPVTPVVPVITVNNTTENTTKPTNGELIKAWRANVTANAGVIDEEASSGSSSSSGSSGSSSSSSSKNTTPALKPAYMISARVLDVAGQGSNGNITTAGSTIKYEIDVNNTGNQELTNITLTGNTLTLGTPTESLSANSSVLDVNESWVYQATYTVTQADINAKTAIQKTVMVDCAELAEKSVTLTTQLLATPSYDVSETVTGSLNAVGDIVSFTTVVKNTGNSDLTGVVVSGSPASMSLVSGDSGQSNILDVGESWTYSGKYTATLNDFMNSPAITNTVSVDCVELEPKNASASANINYKYTSENVQIGSWYAVGANGEKITLINNNSATSPTYAQLLSFISVDNTSSVEMSGSYNDADAAEQLHNNAEAAGYRSAYVNVNFATNQYSRACNAFSTSDAGTIYIDSARDLAGDSANSWDSMATITVGSNYARTSINIAGFVYPVYGAVTRFDVIW
jgi:uncharacterized repeat protein (TIGR01451 family)